MCPIQCIARECHQYVSMIVYRGRHQYVSCIVHRQRMPPVCVYYSIQRAPPVCFLHNAQIENATRMCLLQYIEGATSIPLQCIIRGLHQYVPFIVHILFFKSSTWRVHSFKKKHHKKRSYLLFPPICHFSNRTPLFSSTNVLHSYWLVL